MKTKTIRGALAAVALLVAAMPARAAGDAATVARGRYLVEAVAVCGNCHTPRGPNGPLPGKMLAGGNLFDEPPFTAYGRNITPDPETGVGRWSDAQLIRAIREGIRPDGSLIGPPMPFALYRDIADADIVAIVAYLRTVPAVKNAVPAAVYRIPLPPAYGPPITAEVTAPPRTNVVAYGGYLAGPVAHCVECHTPLLANGTRDMTKVGAGGQPFNGPWGISVAANITSSKEDGLGGWTDAQIERAIRKGISHDDRRLFPPMAFAAYDRMAPDDMKAIIAWLRQVPAQPKQ